MVYNLKYTWPCVFLSPVDEVGRNCFISGYLFHCRDSGSGAGTGLRLWLRCRGSGARTPAPSRSRGVFFARSPGLLTPTRPEPRGIFRQMWTGADSLIRHQNKWGRSVILTCHLEICWAQDNCRYLFPIEPSSKELVKCHSVLGELVNYDEYLERERALCCQLHLRSE